MRDLVRCDDPKEMRLISRFEPTRLRRRDRLLVFETPLEGGPGEGGAPDAVRGSYDRLERRELAEIPVLLGAHHLQEGLDLGLRLHEALAREALCQHRGRRLGDSAPT